jgi:hypothetical protein
MIHLMKSEISNERFILVGQNIVFQVSQNALADAWQVKRPYIHAHAYMVNLAYRIDWFVSNILGQKRRLPRTTAHATYCKSEYTTEKITGFLDPNFSDVLGYIKGVLK